MAKKKGTADTKKSAAKAAKKAKAVKKVDRKETKKAKQAGGKSKRKEDDEDLEVILENVCTFHTLCNQRMWNRWHMDVAGRCGRSGKLRTRSLRKSLAARQPDAPMRRSLRVHLGTISGASVENCLAMMGKRYVSSSHSVILSLILRYLSIVVLLQ